MTVHEIKSEIKRMDPNCSPDSDTFVTAVILLSALEVGANAFSIVRFTGFPRLKVYPVAKAARGNGIWRGDKTVCNWTKEEGGMEFWLDVCVCLGWMIRTG